MTEAEQEAVDAVLRRLDGVDAVSLHLLAGALRAAGQPLGTIAAALAYLASDREASEEPTWLTCLVLRNGLRSVGYRVRLVERLRGAQEPLWRTVAEAAVGLAAMDADA